MHGLVPPHPGPLIAIAAVHANLGLTLGLGILVAIPTVIIAGPLFSGVAARWVPVQAPALFERAERDDDEADDVSRRPGFLITLATVLLPVVLTLAKAIYDIAVNSSGTTTSALDFIGTPLVALLITALVALVTLGRGAGLSLSELADSVSSSFAPIAGITFIVAAGGGFKQVLGGAVADEGHRAYAPHHPSGRVVGGRRPGSRLGATVEAWTSAAVTGPA